MKLNYRKLIKERLEFKKKCGEDITFFEIDGVSYYQIPCTSVSNKEVSRALISEEPPSRYDYYINVYHSFFQLNPPIKKIRHYKNAKRDYRWGYARKVVACDHINTLPNINEFLKTKWNENSNN